MGHEQQVAPPEVTTKPSLAIIVCTFKRQELLKATLSSIAKQRASISPEQVKIYIVDNSDDGEARSIVAAQSGQSPWPMVWLEAHPPNISVARNVGVAAGREDFVAFIDDDQVLEPCWLEAVTQIFAQETGDAWLGEVRADFEALDKTTAASRALFSRTLNEPFGYELFAYGPKKLPQINPATNNSIFRRATTLAPRPTFDPAFGKGGGEDYDLFCRLQRQGKRIFWAPDVKVSEFVPACRCDPAYLRKRFYAGGQAFALAMERNAERPSVMRWLIRIRALAQGLHLALKAPAICIADASARADYVFRWAGVLGKLSFGEIHPLYQPQGSAPSKAQP